LVSGVVIALTAVVAVSLQREVTSGPSPHPAGARNEPVVPALPPMTADEEAFAAALWPLHQEIVEPSAGRLTYAGLAYVIDDRDPQHLATKLTALREVFHDTRDKVAVIPVPSSLQQVRDRYANMLSLYEQSAVEMMTTTRDGNQKHLVDAQQKSEQAVEELVKIGDILWPGEHKPN
jgi:hypothetical protein